MKTLESLHCRQSTPVNSFCVPDSDGTHHSTNTVAKQTNGNSAQDDCGRTQGNGIEKILCRKDLRRLRSIRGRGCSDCTNRVLLQTPRPIVENLESSNPPRQFPLAPFGPPAGLVSITAGKEFGPSISHKVSDQDDECSLNGDQSRFELFNSMSETSWRITKRRGR